MRNQRFVILMSVAAIAAWVAVAGAADEPFDTGTIEFSPSLSFNRTSVTPAGGGSSASATHLSFEGTVGRCMSERFELTGALLAQHRPTGADGRNAFGGSLGAIVNFRQKYNVVPFISASAGVLSYDTAGQRDKAWVVPMVRAGFRTLIDDTRSLNVSIGYQHQSNPDSNFDDSSDVFEVGIGVSWLKPRVQ